MFRFLGISFVLFWLSGCSFTPRICEPNAAREAGVAQAMRGEDYSAAAGGVCTDEHHSVFQTNFQAGYQEGKHRFCDPATVERTAAAHGQQGRASEFTSSAYHICENGADVKIAYGKGYKSGLKNFCSEPEVENAGNAYGAKGEPPQFNAETFSVCGVGQVAKLKGAYHKGHREGLQTFCQGTGVDTQAYQEGTQGIDRSNIDAKFKLCSAAKRSEFNKVSSLNYKKGLGEFCSPAKVTEQGKLQARSGGVPTLPPAYERCIASYPQTRSLFAAAFTEERKLFVEAECTYQKGMAQGQSDAQATNNKKTGMPAFCDSSLFSVYLSGYLEGWKQSKDQICNPTNAYNVGVQQGTAGSPQSFSPPGNCPADYQATLQQKFVEGYNYGNLQRQSTVAYQAVQNGCRFATDCPSNMWCRDRGDGANFCMGKGGRGHFCQSSLDCGTGLFCRTQTNGANIRVCN